MREPGLFVNHPVPDPIADPAVAERLLDRELVGVEIERLREIVAGREILVTGGGGSIGGRLARLLAQLDVSGLTLLDHTERALFWSGEVLKEYAPEVPVRRVLGSVNDRSCLERTLAEARPEMVFHAAAYKHVSMVEENPVAGAETNVLGTDTLLRACLDAGVERLLLISSDKAAKPANVMGATKRVAERLVSAAAPAGYASVRFGNVLGSSGSVLQIFRRRLAAGLPIEVRDPRATRYFMTAEEASQLLILTTGLAQPGDLMVLRVGGPLRIETLAKRLLAECVREGSPAAGAQAEPLRHGELGTGEKLHETLRGGLEEETTECEWVRRLTQSEEDAVALAGGVSGLREACAARDADAVRKLLQELAD